MKSKYLIIYLILYFVPVRKICKYNINSNFVINNVGYSYTFVYKKTTLLAQ